MIPWVYPWGSICYDKNMDIITFIKNLDVSVFLYLNNLPHTPALDFIFLFFSFYPLIIWMLIGMVVLIVEEKTERLFIVRLALALLIAGALASGFIKPLVRRPRPDLAHGQKVVIIEEKPAAIPWNNDFAFPSGHAALAFAGAYILTREENTDPHNRKYHRKRRKLARALFILFAILTGFSRIYLGKHYPLDVFAGALIGWCFGWVVWKLVDLVFPPPVK